MHGKRAAVLPVSDGEIRDSPMAGGFLGDDHEARDHAAPLITPHWIAHEVAMMTGLFPALATRAIELARLHNAKANSSKEKTKALKDEVTVAHAAAELPKVAPNSMQALRREVEALKLANTQTRKRQMERVKETRDKGKEIDHEGHLGPFKRRRQKAESNDYRRQRREEAEAIKLTSVSFSFQQETSYPDEVLNLPFPLQYHVIMSHADNMLARKFYPGPHVQEGLSILDWVRLDFGVNLKYLFPSRFDLSLLKIAFNEFKRSIQWKYFWFKRGESDGISTLD